MSKKKAKAALVLYLPVYHRGHQQLFEKFEQINTLLLVDGEKLNGLFPTHKDLHALPVAVMKRWLEASGRFARVVVVDEHDLAAWRDYELVTADDEVESWLTQNGIKPEQINHQSVFLRWTRRRVLQPQMVGFDHKITDRDEPIASLLARARQAGERSSDFWRQVGCVLQLTDGHEIVTYNHHLPDKQTPYIVGDIRGQFHRGDHWELGSALHAEAAALALAARRGWATVGASLVVTDFPCPNCAKLIGAAGVKTLYFANGYTLADGEACLRAFGVKIVKVDSALVV